MKTYKVTFEFSSIIEQDEAFDAVQLMLERELARYIDHLRCSDEAPESASLEEK